MKTLVAIAALLCGAAGAPALARPLETASIMVSFADLDLSQPRGRVALERRIGSAVLRVCPPTPRPMELAKRQVYRDCRAAAWAGARRQLEPIYSAGLPVGAIIVQAD